MYFQIWVHVKDSSSSLLMVTKMWESFIIRSCHNERHAREQKNTKHFVQTAQQCFALLPQEIFKLCSKLMENCYRFHWTLKTLIGLCEVRLIFVCITRQLHVVVVVVVCICTLFDFLYKKMNFTFSAILFFFFGETWTSHLIENLLFSIEYICCFINSSIPINFKRIMSWG